jgi:serine/threonine-protein kinase HipA
MNLRTLHVYIGERKVGLLFQYGEGAATITRLLPDDGYWKDEQAPLLSWATVIEDPEARRAFWRNPATHPFFNGTGGQLPGFFQNLLPEGPLRRHLESIRKCGKDDHFEILAACGTDLPGNVYVWPAHLDREEIAEIVTQKNDALEVTVTAEPMAGATSLSGVQPKLSLVEKGGRYVARTKNTEGVHIIAKLPAGELPFLPEVEELSLRLAQAVGVNAAKARLAPVDHIIADNPFPLDAQRSFLAVERFDRVHGREHVHCEDFAQILGIAPEEKYSHDNASYGAMARVMLESMRLDREQVSELLRRIAVNEMLGNYDAHVKNFGVIYRDGRQPELSPAYDVVAYACYFAGQGHERLSPATLQAFCNASGFFPTLATKVVSDAVKAACDLWPDMIAGSVLPEPLKTRLLDHFSQVDAVGKWRRRMAKASPARSST